MKFLLSVVIPAFNAETTIATTLNSIASQIETDVEVIVIDDQSTDDTIGAINTQAKKLGVFINLLRNTSKGVSSARNVGIDAAKGRYITFVDADDFIKPGYFNRIRAVVENNSVDMIYFRHSKLNAGGVVLERSSTVEDHIVSGDDFVRLLSLGKITNSVCDKVFKSNVLKSMNVRFSEHIRIGEDAAFTAIASFKVAAVYLSTSDYYVYNQTNLGTMRDGLGIDKFQQVLSSLEYIRLSINRSESCRLFPVYMLNLFMPYILMTDPKELFLNNEFIEFISKVKYSGIPETASLKQKIVVFLLVNARSAAVLKCVQIIYSVCINFILFFSGKFFWGAK